MPAVLEASAPVWHVSTLPGSLTADGGFRIVTTGGGGQREAPNNIVRTEAEAAPVV